jgi:tetratricopeptide (TPR) repeat protein
MNTVARPALLTACLALAALTTSAHADEADAWIAEGLAAEARQDPLAALEAFRRADRARPDDPYILRKVAQQLSDATFVLADEPARLAYAREALTFIERASTLDPRCPVTRLSFSVLYGKLASSADVRMKVDYARRIRRHAEEALALDPTYAWAHHVLGRWHVELSQLGGARRALAGLLFGGLPPASLGEGIRLLERAVALEPDAIAHRVELGFAYARAGRAAEARAQWQAALDLPPARVYDQLARERAHEALAG